MKHGFTHLLHKSEDTSIFLLYSKDIYVPKKFYLLFIFLLVMPRYLNFLLEKQKV